MRRRLIGSEYPTRLVGYVLATNTLGLALTVVAGAVFVTSGDALHQLPAAAVFFAFTLLAELRPVPVDLEGKHVVSLAFMFVVASQLICSWEVSVLIGAIAIAVGQLPDRIAPLKLLFNTSVYAVAAAAASIPALIAGLHGIHAGYGTLTAIVFAAGAVFVAINVVLVCIAVALASGVKVREILTDHLRHSGPAFLIMVFLAAQVVIFWHISPFLLILVGAPLFTLDTYQRSLIRGHAAMKAATTDSLTGLKNHRAYQEEIEPALAAAAEAGEIRTLCLIDVDRFKQVNDRHGHPAGDAVLRVIGELLEEIAPACGYRIGGDEFALVYGGDTEDVETMFAEIQARLRVDHNRTAGERLTVSAGIATFPVHAADAGELKKCADLALYKSKNNGKDRASVYTGGDLFERAFSVASDEDDSRDDRLRIAERLVAVVDARDAYVGRHSAGVARLVEAIGQTLGLDDDELGRLRLAGLLHDLGKIAVPDSILDKPTPLAPDEEELMQRHPQTGFELLDGLDLAPVDTWILHHHEHWDGSGYPAGLAGEDIPFGSRLILVADAFEAMTTHRSYRRAISVEAAIQELHEKAGAQFDPFVVDALERCLASKDSFSTAELVL